MVPHALTGSSRMQQSRTEAGSGRLPSSTKAMASRGGRASVARAGGAAAVAGAGAGAGAGKATMRGKGGCSGAMRMSGGNRWGWGCVF